jgi:Ser-tRNA(Ala) deacylase AlaX
MQSFADLPDIDRSLIKPGSLNPEPTHAVICETTIFHPQGGGQPSDTGTIVPSSNGQSESAFEVSMVRHSISAPSLVLHFGHFSGASSLAIEDGMTVMQQINVDKRMLYSRCHTAGHVLGAAVRHLLENNIEGFDELKASHFPDSAACEFQGLIYGDQKQPIQEKVDEYVKAHMPVEIDFWSRDDFKKNGLERLIPGDDDWNMLAEVEGESRIGKIRVVNIVGAEVYPCGGTHVDFSDECGPVTVKKVGRSKGTSRVSYAVQ